MTSPGKYSGLPAMIPAGLGQLGHYYSGSLPRPPAAVPVPPVPAGWGMLGNDTEGDCGVAGLEHGLMADAVITHRPGEQFPGPYDAVEYYLAYTGGQDTGVVLSAFLAYVRQHGYFGHSVHAYAPVAVQDVPTLLTAVEMFGFAYTGITVTQAMEDAFNAGQPWTADLLDSPVAGGHCVPIVGYDDQFLTAVTWGSLQQIAYPAWHLMADEAWALVTGEFVARNGDGRGFGLAALEADLNRLAT